MNNDKLYEKYVLNKFYKYYNIDKNKLLKSNHEYFRYLCFKYLDFIRYLKLPNFKLISDYEAVLIEYRSLPHLEFLIRNTIIKLGEEWCHTVICGNLNYDFMFEICSRISSNIKIIKTNYDNLLPSDYSKFLTSLSFWDLLIGEKILIYQEDSIIFKDNIMDFIEFDYIGAPFPKNKNDTPNSVGNGGFSLRSKKAMIDVINFKSINDTIFNSSTLDYMKYSNLNFPPEDVYFSKNMQECNIGKVSNWDTAFSFSTESIYNANSLGGHKFWIQNDHWKQRVKKIYNLNKYKFRSNLDNLLSYYNLPYYYNNTKTISNAFDIDIKFCHATNNLHYNVRNYDYNNKIIRYIKDTCIKKGYLYHPKQLINIYPNAEIYIFNKKYFVEHKLKIYPINLFVNKYLYSKSFDEFTNITVINKYDNLSEKHSLLLILVFIGNEERGSELISNLITYDRKIRQKFNVAFCFNSVNVCLKFKEKIKKNFIYYSIFITKEYGTDIIPTLMMYNAIRSKYKFIHIIKLHSKRIYKPFTDLTKFLLSHDLEYILRQQSNICNCIGHPDYYIKLSDDIFNKVILKENYYNVNVRKTFIAGTIFYCNYIIFDKVIDFIKNNNYRAYILNNLYENNTINKEYSPIHFLERLFGIINYE
jgi:hypothetical protein